MGSILTIGFEGLHRSGKWTQMTLLKKYFENKLSEVFLIRGEYYRKWLGNGVFFDPISTWWQNNRDNDELNYEKSQRLNREIRLRLDKMSSQSLGHSDRVILFDRTILSRHFLDSRKNEGVSFANIKHIDTKSWRLIEKVIPSIIFAFKCDKQALLDRLYVESLADKHLNYKKTIINKHTDDFNSYLESSIPEPILNKVVVIDGNKHAQWIHKEIVQHIESYILTKTGWKL